MVITITIMVAITVITTTIMVAAMITVTTNTTIMVVIWAGIAITVAEKYCLNVTADPIIT